MKTTTEKDFDAVRFMRTERSNLSAALSKLSKAEVIAFFQDKKSKLNTRPKA